MHSCFTPNLVPQHVREYASCTSFNSLQHYHLRKSFTHLYKKLFCLLHFNENNLNNNESFVTRNVEMFSRIQTMKMQARRHAMFSWSLLRCWIVFLHVIGFPRKHPKATKAFTKWSLVMFCLFSSIASIFEPIGRFDAFYFPSYI